ncbi:unnamed protein product [Caenorhabditis bovis]|uniref:Ubiquitin-like domain-containing protein n=1 Tax=Caenorhabditis bovis TaxID=2654633 RepID=A0A8S1ENR8_9PELO|nr:unnamed protein product [Caenorhabditis bovis]
MDLITQLTEMVGETQFTIIACTCILSLCIYLSVQLSSRRPMYYNIFVVEMHTWSERRIVQVLHLGQEYNPNMSWTRIISRMRARAPRIAGDTRVAISDTNIVVLSPVTVIESPANAISLDPERITLWDIEMPPRTADHPPDSARDSQYAAAAAIAILARGDESTLENAGLLNQMAASNPSTHRSAERHIITYLEELNFLQVPTQLPTLDLSETEDNEPVPSEIITTDVTYTTPQLRRSDRPFSATLVNSRNSRPALIPPPSPPMAVPPSSPQDTDNETTESESEEEQPPTMVSGEILSQEPSTSTAPQHNDGTMSLIRLKFMNDDMKDTYAHLTDTVAMYKIRAFGQQKSSQQVVRLIYQGQLLREDNRTLESYGVKDGSILHCHISTTPYASPPTNEIEQGNRRRSYRQSQETRRRNNLFHSLPDDDDTFENLDHIHFAEPQPEPSMFAGLLNAFYELSESLLPILLAIGFGIMRTRAPPRNATDERRYNFIFIIYQFAHNYFMNNGNMNGFNVVDRIQRNSYSYLWLFGCQLAAILSFICFFPEVVDRTAIGLMVLLSLYFVFVVYRGVNARQEPADVINSTAVQQPVANAL